MKQKVSKILAVLSAQYETSVVRPGAERLRINLVSTPICYLVRGEFNFSTLHEPYRHGMHKHTAQTSIMRYFIRDYTGRLGPKSRS